MMLLMTMMRKTICCIKEDEGIHNSKHGLKKSNLAQNFTIIPIFFHIIHSYYKANSSIFSKQYKQIY